jgi:DNA invertase Pin-like site-specific DNA recombinase
MPRLNSRSVIYLRISTKDGETANQLFGMKKFIKSLPSRPRIVEEHGSSFHKPLPLLTGIIEDITLGLVDELAIWKVDRTSRDHGVDASLWRLCERVGCRLRYVADRLDSKEKGHRQLFDMLSIMGEHERMTISERVKLSYERRKSENPNAKFGGRKKFQFNKAVNDKIPGIVSAYQRGESLYRISRTTGLTWMTIQRVLIYKGLYKPQKPRSRVRNKKVKKCTAKHK